mmetsp:Transcript_5959/g.15899  ORF Transcript_5959/g.15899 Transcript_5959/m.15899 type:complete len:271 (-) Transcript_5959:169-981(-)
MPVPNDFWVISIIWRTGLPDCLRTSAAADVHDMPVEATARPLGGGAPPGAAGLPRGVASVPATQAAAAGAAGVPGLTTLPRGNLGRNDELLPKGGATTVGGDSSGPRMRSGDCPPEDSTDEAGLSRKGEPPPCASMGETAGLIRSGDAFATVVAGAKSIDGTCGLARKGEAVPCPPALGVWTAAAVTGVRVQERMPSISRSLSSVSLRSRSDICLPWSESHACRFMRWRPSWIQPSCRAACWSRESPKPTGTQTETPPVCTPSGGSRPRS